MNSYSNVNEGKPMTLDKAIRMEGSTREDGSGTGQGEDGFLPSKMGVGR
jgi:hypothetical protein